MSVRIVLVVGNYTANIKSPYYCTDYNSNAFFRPKKILDQQDEEHLHFYMMTQQHQKNMSHVTIRIVIIIAETDAAAGLCEYTNICVKKFHYRSILKVLQTPMNAPDEDVLLLGSKRMTISTLRIR